MTPPRAPCAVIREIESAASFSSKCEMQLAKNADVSFIKSIRWVDKARHLFRDNHRAIGIHNYGGCDNKASDLYQKFIDEVAHW